MESVENMNRKTYQASNAKNFPEQTDISCRDIESDLEGISVSSVSNLSDFSVDWSEHDMTAKAVWSRHSDLNSDLNQAKERIRAREAGGSRKSSSYYPGQMNNYQNPVEYNIVQQNHGTGYEDFNNSSSSSFNQENDVNTNGTNNDIDHQVKSINVQTNKKLKAVSVEDDTLSNYKKKIFGLDKRKWLVIGGFMLIFILIVALIILAVEVGQVQETVQYIENIFIDNDTFADTFSRFDME